MNIVFMGTPDFAKESLQALVENGHNIQLVITNPDRPKGRGMKLQASPVKEYALEQKIEVEQPLKLKDNDELIEKIKRCNPDVICVVAYGRIIPNSILEIPKIGCINVHGSLLPKYRGAAPIQWAVLNGDKTTGITTMFVNEKMDEGDILLKEEVEIGDNETTGELWNRLSTIGANLLVQTLDKISNNDIVRIPQETAGEATYAPMLEKSMAEIKWNEQSAKEIKNLVRGLNPIMGAYTFIEKKKLKLWEIDILSNDNFQNEFDMLTSNLKNFSNGEIVLINKKNMYIKAKDAIIVPIEVQPENSRKMKIEEFLAGFKKN